jgi:5-methylcytosine-specific restriction endonuclease McrA
MIMRSCLGVESKRCGRLIPPSQTRCEQCQYEHQRLRDQRRGSSAQRGYDRQYRAARLRVLEAAGYVCAYCGREATTTDHVLPVSRGGTADDDNLVACCSTCNSARGARGGAWRA